MKPVQLRVPERLRRKIVTMVALAAATAPAACAAEADEDVDESGAAASTSSKKESLSCDESINKVDDIRNRFLDERHAAVWAFQTDAKSAFEKLPEAPSSFAQKGLVSSLENVSYETWTPSAKVRVRDARLATSYLVVRGEEKGGSKVVYLLDASTQAVLATGRATKAGIWSWSCPAPSGGASAPCRAARGNTGNNWNNWPNWQNWANWDNCF